MPPSKRDQDDITDDYVTEMLKRDAKASSASAAATSLGHLLNKRPTSSAPKPNTRFLRNILRDTDNHNAALLAKEAQESSARLKKLSRTHRPEQELYSARQRHDPNKRRRLNDDPPSRRSDTASRRRHHHSPDHDPTTDCDHQPALSTSRSNRRASPSPDPDPRERSRHSKPRASHSNHDDHTRKRPRHDRQRSASPHRRRRDKRRESFDRPRPRPRKRRDSDKSEHSDSDPLDAIIGPAPPSANPPVRSRGRGTLNNSSTIDDHFSTAYDPTVDVQPEARQDDDDDWDQALEALRDRQKWKQQGADRLRAAGFTDGEITKWEKGGEKSEQDVVWTKKGEGREWDRGKVLDDDQAIVNVKPEWGRLKDT